MISEGSVVVQVALAVPASSACGVQGSIQNALSDDTIANAVMAAVATLDGIDNVSSGSITSPAASLSSVETTASCTESEYSQSAPGDADDDPWHDTLTWWQWILFGVGILICLLGCFLIWIAFCCPCQCCHSPRERRRRRAKGGHHGWGDSYYDYAKDVPTEPTQQIHERVRGRKGGVAQAAAQNWFPSGARSPRAVQPARPLTAVPHAAGRSQSNNDLARATFSPGTLGLFIAAATACVENVERGGQAERVGVQVGWKLKTIDHKPYSAKLLASKVLGHEPYEVVFVVKASPTAELISPPADLGLHCGDKPGVRGMLPVGNHTFTL